ncbi:hypothetical protein AHAS_Ahas03G0139700 [Arachis hypogaea]
MNVVSVDTLNTLPILYMNAVFLACITIGVNRLALILDPTTFYVTPYHTESYA